jgi:signal transduction histidine kinase
MEFKIHPRVVEQLGKELITSDEVALLELVKNAYDAKAKKVSIQLISDCGMLTDIEYLAPLNPEIKEKLCEQCNKWKLPALILIEDIGVGMTSETIQDGFLTAGTEIKLHKKNEQKGSASRVTLGEKGLGRLATQRLSKYAVLETAHADSESIHFLTIDWAVVKDGNSGVQHSEFKKHTQTSYTRIWLPATNAAIQQFVELSSDNKPRLSQKYASAINFLHSPFENSEDQFSRDDFTVIFKRDGEELVNEFSLDFVNVAESVHSFSWDLNDAESKGPRYALELRPWYLERLHFNELGKDLYHSFRRSPEYYGTLLDKYSARYDKNLRRSGEPDQFVGFLAKEAIDAQKDLPLFELSEPTPSEKIIRYLKDLGSIEVKIYSFKRQKALQKMSLDSAIANEMISPDNKVNSNDLVHFLQEHNGIKLYRGPHRIGSLGNRDNDWLNLQQARTKGQQFYRFELGNVVGYVRIGDLCQEFIREVSSREDINNNQHALVLKALLSHVVNDLFYRLSKNSAEITRDIFADESMIPENSIHEISKKIDSTDTLFSNFRKNMTSFNSVLAQVRDLNWDSKEDLKKAKRAIKKIDDTFSKVVTDIDETENVLKNTQVALKTVQEHEQRIQIESFNNYKLMANGLITETLSHELQSLLLNASKMDDARTYIDPLETFLLAHDARDLCRKSLDPLDDLLHLWHTRMQEMNRFYEFLEKTFIHNDGLNALKPEPLYEFFNLLHERLAPDLKKSRIEFDYEMTQGLTWNVPPGVLIHVFYNLITNSIFWIKEKRNRGSYDEAYKDSGRDFIKVEFCSGNELRIVDSGTGVLPQMEDTLFHPLESGKPSGKGRGMGLYIVRKLLNSFDADIDLMLGQNKYGNRGVFRVQLDQPLNEQEESA